MRLRALRKKLHSARGASLLFALLLLLVAAAVSATILSAAVSAAARISNDRLWQQRHLSLTSAAGLLRECLEESETRCKVTTCRTTVLLDGDVISVDYSDPRTYLDRSPLGTTLGRTLKSAVEDANNGVQSASTAVETFSIQVSSSDPSAEDALAPVSASCALTTGIKNPDLVDNANPVLAVTGYEFQLFITLTTGDAAERQQLYLLAANENNPTPFLEDSSETSSDYTDEEGVPHVRTIRTEDLAVYLYLDRFTLSTSERQLRGTESAEELGEEMG